MNTSLDCLPCLFRQTLDAVRRVSDDPALYERVVMMLSGIQVFKTAYRRPSVLFKKFCCGAALRFGEQNIPVLMMPQRCLRIDSVRQIDSLDRNEFKIIFLQQIAYIFKRMFFAQGEGGLGLKLSAE